MKDTLWRAAHCAKTAAAARERAASTQEYGGGNNGAMPRLGWPQPDRAGRQRLQRHHQRFAALAQLVDRRRLDDVVAAEMEDREVEVQIRVVAALGLRDGMRHPRARLADVDDVGVGEVSGKQTRNGFLGQDGADAHAGAVAEDQDRQALRREPPLVAPGLRREAARTLHAAPEDSRLDQRRGDEQQRNEKAGLANERRRRKKELFRGRHGEMAGSRLHFFGARD